MKFLNNFFHKDDNWFYSNPPTWARLLTVYVKGDMLVLLPLCISIMIVGLFSKRFMLLLFAILYTVRGLGEMIYWLLQQFGLKSYRPNDFGLRNYKNDAIYILYQVSSLASTVIGFGAIAWVILYLY